jgi:hypothetical protein
MLITEPDRFNSFLREIPWSLDIWQVRRLDLDVGSSASDLHELLCSDAVPGIGWVTAGKLLAAKRPRLVPILDKEVQAFLQPRPRVLLGVDVRRTFRRLSPQNYR